MKIEDKISKGSCLCGKVTYQICSPFLFFQYCHCSRCRKSSGAAHAANILVKASQFKWTGGAECIQRFELPSASLFCNGFCSTCGSKMPWQTKSGKYFLVPAGTLDDDPGINPERNVFWKSHAPWYVNVVDLPKFDEDS